MNVVISRCTLGFTLGKNLTSASSVRKGSQQLAIATITREDMWRTSHMSATPVLLAGIGIIESTSYLGTSPASTVRHSPNSRFRWHPRGSRSQLLALSTSQSTKHVSVIAQVTTIFTTIMAPSSRRHQRESWLGHRFAEPNSARTFWARILSHFKKCTLLRKIKTTLYLMLCLNKTKVGRTLLLISLTRDNKWRWKTP